VRRERVRVLRTEQRTTMHISGSTLSSLIFGRGRSYLLSLFVNDDVNDSVVDDIDTYIYFVTFETATNRRLEFKISEDDYGDYQPEDPESPIKIIFLTHFEREIVFVVANIPSSEW